MRLTQLILATGLLFNWLTYAVLASLTDGWTLDSPQAQIQSPYNLPHSARYTLDTKTDTYHLWVFNTDKPMGKNNPTEPRTELSFAHYTSGRHEFDADFLVPTNTSRVTIMQVFGGQNEGNAKHATALQLRIYDGSLKRYDEETLLTNVYDKWFHLNVIHDAGTHEIQIFIDGKLALITKDFGGGDWHFKCGVYAQKNPSPEMEVYCRNVRIYRQ